MNTKPYYPHREVKNRWSAVTIFLIASVIALAAFGCDKSAPLDTTEESGHANLKMKDSVYKMQGWNNHPVDTVCDLKY